MSAFRLGAHYGYRMFECDAKLSKDGVLFLMHDATLNRTTNAQGMGSDLTMGEIAQLDAGSWHSRAFAGEALPTLEALSRWCLANHYFLNVEIKPTPGQELETGRACGALMNKIWPQTEVQPLFTSFKPDALQGAKEVAPHIPAACWWTSWPIARAMPTCRSPWIWAARSWCSTTRCGRPSWWPRCMVQACAAAATR